MQRKSLASSFLFLCLTLAAAGEGAESRQGSRSPQARVDNRLNLPTDRHQQVDALFAPWSGKTTPGCAVGISRDGAQDYARGYGMSNLEYDVKITPQSIFHIASISKQFTAFSIGLLVQEGKLSLDDDIRKYLPEMPDHGKTITM
ncbi:serine hydrolase domain-containing protein [Pyxidicoccus caerfyrddinensis]|uniref:serine hydrolase domain-containing protein n=1 Tax=Pyxidicoccus caerfyrddinensis TaxID=2709663 RepID=UPI001F085DBF|nr:serine hydrolase [Pyxidicoccus caerfyrddinensis]